MHSEDERQFSRTPRRCRSRRAHCKSGTLLTSFGSGRSVSVVPSVDFFFFPFFFQAKACAHVRHWRSVDEYDVGRPVDRPLFIYVFIYFSSEGVHPSGIDGWSVSMCRRWTSLFMYFFEQRRARPLGIGGRSVGVMSSVDQPFCLLLSEKWRVCVRQAWVRA